MEKIVENPGSREKLISALFWGGVLIALAALGPTFGFLRTGLALLMFGGLTWFGMRQVRSMMTNLPEPEVEDVSDYDLRYVCRMCGLELKVEVAARDRAPTHCMEPMELVNARS